MLERIEVNPRKLAGKAVIRGTRIPVYLILELLENGYTFKKIIEAYPVLTEEDIKAAIEYSAKLLKNEEVVEYGVT
ncbi:MAG: DUF433 domain-containing protein [Candidatus Hydrothermarchaeota archaeon]|nr:DUF433 domain-containing protein [Candidatus Hydrothermarchaeota archaeon]